MSVGVQMAVFNFEPKFCPGCGRSRLITPAGSVQWDAGESRECRKCGTITQRAWAQDIVKAAEEFNQPVPEVRESHTPVG